jgi:hypothetical protein
MVYNRTFATPALCTRRRSEIVEMGVPPGNRRGPDLRRTCSVRRKVRDPRTPGRTVSSAVAAGGLGIMRARGACQVIDASSPHQEYEGGCPPGEDSGDWPDHFRALRSWWRGREGTTKMLFTLLFSMVGWKICKWVEFRVCCVYLALVAAIWRGTCQVLRVQIF